MRQLRSVAIVVRAAATPCQRHAAHVAAVRCVAPLSWRSPAAATRVPALALRQLHVSAAYQATDETKSSQRVARPRAVKDISQEAEPAPEASAWSNPLQMLRQRLDKAVAEETNTATSSSVDDSAPKAAAAAAPAAADPPESPASAAEHTHTHARTQTAAEEGERKPAKRSMLMRLWEDAKDVFAVTFGVARQRDVGADVDAGIREYPWISFMDASDPSAPQRVYYNRDTGERTGVKPSDWDVRAPASANVDLNVEASALTTTKEQSTAWERTLRVLSNTPVISQMIAAASAVADSEGVKRVQTAVKDKIEDAREVWETSQHPLVVNASYVVDRVMGETEQGRALREMQLLDSGFDQYAFIEEMQNNFIPTVVKAFFRMDNATLREKCKDTALAQMRATAAAREAEGISMDGTVLNVQRTEIISANTLERGAPVMLISALVQYIHCVRNKMGEVIDGGESEIRAAMFVFAISREMSASSKGNLDWKVVELSMSTSQLYL